jgi:signal transduction histidine kinase
MHGARLFVVSEEGLGSRFVIAFPLSARLLPLPAAPASAVPA